MTCGAFRMRNGGKKRLRRPAGTILVLLFIGFPAVLREHIIVRNEDVGMSYNKITQRLLVLFSLL